MIAKVHRVRIASLPPLEVDAAYLRPSQWRHIDLNRALFAQSGGGRVDGSNDSLLPCRAVLPFRAEAQWDRQTAVRLPLSRAGLSLEWPDLKLRVASPARTETGWVAARAIWRNLAML